MIPPVVEFPDACRAPTANMLAQIHGNVSIHRIGLCISTNAGPRFAATMASIVASGMLGRTPRCGRWEDSSRISCLRRHNGCRLRNLDALSIRTDPCRTLRPNHTNGPEPLLEH